MYNLSKHSPLIGGGGTTREAVSNPYEEIINNARDISGILNLNKINHKISIQCGTYYNSASDATYEGYQKNPGYRQDGILLINETDYEVIYFYNIAYIDFTNPQRTIRLTLATQNQNITISDIAYKTIQFAEGSVLNLPQPKISGPISYDNNKMYIYYDLTKENCLGIDSWLDISLWDYQIPSIITITLSN